MEDKHPTTPRRNPRSADGRHSSIDSSSSPGGRSNSSLSSSPGSHVFRMLGKLSKNKKDSLKMPKDGSMSSINTNNSGASRERTQPRLTMKKKDEDSAFLRNLRGGGSMASASANQTPPSYSDADSAFLRAVRGETVGVSSSGKIEKKTSFDDSSHSKGESSYSEADNAFLRAFRGEEKPPAQAPSSGYKEQQQQQIAAELPSVDETNTLPIDEMAHANAAFLGALHASSDTQDDNPKPGGTFVFESKNSTPSSQGDANSAFLLAMRQSSSLTSRHPSSFGGTGEWTQQTDTGEWNSGTLVLNSTKDSVKDKREEESRSFLMSIQAGQASEDLVFTNKEEFKEESDTEDECDDDMEGLVVPSYPYIEKVLLPRPLFFGHQLPPRVIEEAKQAAKLYVNEPKADKQHWCEKDDEAGLASSSESIKDTDDGSTVTKSTISTFSTTVGGGKLFEPSVLPCARNFEGALETFGFGQNPFHQNRDNMQDEEGTDSGLPKEPHPYVSIYSPVWGDRARADRARSRIKRAKLAEATATEEAPAGLLVKDLSTRSYDSANHISCGSDDGSIEFKDTSKTLTATTEEANNAFLSQLRGPPDDADGGDFSRDQFSMLARGNSPTLDAPAPSEAPNDLSSRDQFLMFARGDDAGGTFVGSPVIDKKGGTFVCSKPSNAFAAGVGSDDDSIEAAEERKAVGLNDNMAAAAAMLAGKEVDIDGDENGHIGTAMCNLAAGGGAKAAKKYGRPYSNLELTGGCVPRFSCDDPSLPHESDLGVFETKEDEKRTNEYRREKNIIEDMTVPGIMPLVVCPSQCTDADDSQSWNSRAAANDNGGHRKANNTVIISLDGNSPTSSGSAPCKTSQTYETSRVGWWNLPDGVDDTSASAGKRESKKKTQGTSLTVDVFPATDEPIPLDVITNLWPSPQVLRDNNISAAQLHSATSSGELHWSLFSASNASAPR